MAKRLTRDIKTRISEMWEQGHSRQDIADTFGVSLVTVDRYKAGAVDKYHKGGVISRGMLISPVFDNKTESIEVDRSEDDDSSVIIADKSIVIAGVKSCMKYTVGLRKDSILVEGDGFETTFKLVNIPDICKELMAVYKKAMLLKKEG